MVKFDKSGKLSPRYIGSFEVLERVDIVAYLLAPRNKKSDFSADLSEKKRFSGGMEMILTKKNRKKKNR